MCFKCPYYFCFFSFLTNNKWTNTLTFVNGIDILIIAINWFVLFLQWCNWVIARFKSRTFAIITQNNNIKEKNSCWFICLIVKIDKSRWKINLWCQKLNLKRHFFLQIKFIECVEIFTTFDYNVKILSQKIQLFEQKEQLSQFVLIEREPEQRNRFQSFGEKKSAANRKTNEEVKNSVKKWQKIFC